jgi:TrmH family RNA methyltransferase
MAGEESTGQRPLDIAQTLTLIEQLQVSRRARDTHGLFFVEGVRSFVTAVDHECRVEALLYSERLLTSPLARKLVRRLKRAGVPFARVSPEQFRTVSRAERASGVGAILRQRVHDLQRVTPGDQLCWIALDHVRAPGNFGTLVRTAAAIGAAGFILLGGSIDPFDPAVVRATMGALFRQMVVRADAEQLSHWVQMHQLQVVGASPDGAVDYDQVRYARPTVLLLGEERRGLTAGQRALCHEIVRIPMVEGSDSLNLAVAGSLLLYEIARSSLRQ